MRIFLNKRKVDENYDVEPSIAHIFHYDISKKIIKGKKVLDVDCWTGQYTGLIAGICEVVGTDISSIKFIEKVAKRELYQKSGFEAIYLIAEVKK